VSPRLASWQLATDEPATIVAAPVRLTFEGYPKTVTEMVAEPVTEMVAEPTRFVEIMKRLTSELCRA